MKTTFAKAALAGTAMTAAIVMGAGTASAATVGAAGTAGTGTPTGDYQVCGTAYVGADAHVGAPPAGSQAVSGLPISGTLYNAGGGVVATYSTTTASDGTWCLQGTKAMADTVQANGYVTMAGPAAFTDTATGISYAGAWSGGGTDTTIGAIEFLKHGWPFPIITAKSAWKVNAVYHVVP